MGLNARTRGRKARDAQGAAEPTGRREQAAELRTRATEIRAEVEAQEGAERERRAAAAAAVEAQELAAQDLDAKARELDLEQERQDRSIELRRQADEADASAAELDAQVRLLDEELLAKDARVRLAEQQLADIGPRRETLQRQANEAAENGDTEAILEAERELTLLPALERRLAEQRDAASAAVTDTAARAAEAQVAADQARWSAIDLRRWADTDALTPAPPELPEHEQKIRERQRPTVWQETQAREAALHVIRELPNPDDRDAALTVLANESETRRASQAASLHAGDIETLDKLGRLASQVREAAAAEASLWQHAPLEARRVGPMATSEREQLAAAVTAYRARLGRDLPRCRQLAAAERFGVVEGRLLPDRFAADAAEVATAAEAELTEERAVLEAT